MSRQSWYKMRSLGTLLIGIGLVILSIWVLAGVPQRRVVDTGPLTIREEVVLIHQCRAAGDEPWADEGGYVHCRPVTSEVHDVAP
jgi:hypothetical protein